MKHLCPSWDFMEIKEGSPEETCCNCKNKNKEFMNQWEKDRLELERKVRDRLKRKYKNV